MAIDVTDLTFKTDVLDASAETPVVVNLWAPWCNPCTTLGPILEKVVDETGGAVRLAKVNVDENPHVSNTFAVSSIPAVFAIHKGKIVDQFIGLMPEASVREFVTRLQPKLTEADVLTEKGDEDSLRKALDLEPDHAAAILALAGLLTERGEADEALNLLARLPETPEVRKAAARARLAMTDDGDEVGVATYAGPSDDHLEHLLTKVKDDQEARQELLDLLETMDAADPRRVRYRKALAARLF